MTPEIKKHIEDADFECALLEDVLHGNEAKIVTNIRKHLSKAMASYQHLQENGRVAELEKEVEVIAMQRDYFIKDQAAKHNEIERLKGLAMKMFADGLKAFMPMTDLEIDKCIEQFKTENNL